MERMEIARKTSENDEQTKQDTVRENDEEMRQRREAEMLFWQRKKEAAHLLEVDV